MIVLGISGFYHDSAAALVRDDEIVAAAQEERFTCVKHDAGFPAKSIAYCLAEAGVALDQIDYAVFYDKPLLTFNRLLETYLAYAPRGLPSFVTAIPVWVKEKILQKDSLKAQRLAGTLVEDKMFDSITTPMPPAFTPLPERAAILDGRCRRMGDDHLRPGRGRDNRLVQGNPLPHSSACSIRRSRITSASRSMRANTR